jgi:hypothetical protein
MSETTSSPPTTSSAPPPTTSSAPPPPPQCNYAETKSGGKGKAAGMGIFIAGVIICVVAGGSLLAPGQTKAAGTILLGFIVFGLALIVIGGVIWGISSDPITERSAYPTNAPCTIASTNYMTITSGSLCSCPTVSPPASDKGNTKPV